MYAEHSSAITSSSLPSNITIDSLAGSLAIAHKAYGSAKGKLTKETGVLFIVQPNNVNTCDERPIEYALWEQGVPAYRLEFGETVLSSTSLTPSRELILSLAPLPEKLLEISVIYLRAGYDQEEYYETGIQARLQLERSRAIKCPSILGHLATLKKVQQELAVPGSLARFLPLELATRISPTFAPLYPLDDSEIGKIGKSLACNPETAHNYVLKPSLEGGGHNVYGEAIPPFLKTLPPPLWSSYILMEKIKSPKLENKLLWPHDAYAGLVISELGIFGTCLWRRETHSARILENKYAGFSFKTKAESADEMSVVKGYGCFDSPCLV